MVTIIDYGIGNLRSIEKAFQAVGAEVRRTDDAGAIRDAERVVLPGVGAFGACMGEIRSRDLVTPIHDVIDAGTPFLGVCIGMQLLFETSSERGAHEGLGVLPGDVVHFHEAHEQDFTGADGEALTVPHMGWNGLAPTRDHPLLDAIDDGAHVYFVHSYHVRPERDDDVLATATYGHAFPAMVQRNNVMGVQFHPEKSQYHGLKLLSNFAQLARSGVPA
jgi:glutamine amidotransferase